MCMNLYAANEQWHSRPADERFETLENLAEATKSHAATAKTVSYPTSALTVVPTERQMAVVSPTGGGANLTHWSFGQLSRAVGAPAGYLQSLGDKNLVAQCLNHGLKQVDKEHESVILIHENGQRVCRQFASEQYARIWNYQLAEKCVELQQAGWRVPPARPAHYGQPGSRPATEADCLRLTGNSGLSIKPGDLIAPAGIYASDHDMFVFMVNEDENFRIDDGTDGGLGRGFFISNSEVGAASLKITWFCYRYVCGNHIVWDASQVKELKIVHKGGNDRSWQYKARQFVDVGLRRGLAEDAARIEAAKTTKLCDRDQDPVEFLFAKKFATKKVLEASWKHAKLEADLRPSVDPKSVWGFVNGITSASQDTGFADDRVEIDRLAGKLMSMAF